MVKAPLVTPDLEFGENIIRHLDAARFPTSVVAWYLEDGLWKLLIGTPLEEKVGHRGAFHKLRDALSTERPVGVSSLPIYLEGSRSPLVKQIRKRFAKNGAEQGDRFGNFVIGPRYIEDGYIYRFKK